MFPGGGGGIHVGLNGRVNRVGGKVGPIHEIGGSLDDVGCPNDQVAKRKLKSAAFQSRRIKQSGWRRLHRSRGIDDEGASHPENVKAAVSILESRRKREHI